MRHVVLTFFIVGLFCSCNQPQTSESQQTEGKTVKEAAPDMVVEDSVVYGFINEVIDGARPDSTVDCDKLADKTIIGFTHTEIDSAHLDSLLFSKKDITFIQRQLSVMQYFKLNPQDIHNKQIISSDTLMTFFKKREGSESFWSSYRKKYGKGGFCSMSMPLFSLDKETAIFHMSYHCGGMCGHGGTYIYKRKKGKWTVVKELSSWIS